MPSKFSNALVNKNGFNIHLLLFRLQPWEKIKISSNHTDGKELGCRDNESLFVAQKAEIIFWKILLKQAQKKTNDIKSGRVDAHNIISSNIEFESLLIFNGDNRNPLFAATIL